MNDLIGQEKKTFFSGKHQIIYRRSTARKHQITTVKKTKAQLQRYEGLGKVEIARKITNIRCVHKNILVCCFKISDLWRDKTESKHKFITVQFNQIKDNQNSLVGFLLVVFPLQSEVSKQTQALFTGFNIGIINIQSAVLHRSSTGRLSVLRTVYDNHSIARTQVTTNVNLDFSSKHSFTTLLRALTSILFSHPHFASQKNNTCSSNLFKYGPSHSVFTWKVTQLSHAMFNKWNVTQWIP